MGDSDLFSKLSQSLIHPCSQNQTLLCKPQKDRRVIPGPAGMVQAAMHRPETRLVHVVGAAADDDAADADFFLNPWLSALEYLGFGRNYLPTQTNSGIISIKTHRTPHRAQQVVGIVSTCRPNTMGGLFITLKDPTGSIAASVHHKVLAENRELGVGCVVILKQVVVFPVRTTSYLNITPNNVVKLFSKDCGPLPQVSPITRPITYGKENEEEEDSMKNIASPVRMASDKYPDVSKVMEVADAGTGSSEVSLPKIQIPKVLSASVVAEWSDVQINELFSDYLDDGDLIITPNNMVKLFSQDCGPPLQASPITKPVAYGKENEEEDSMRNIAKRVKMAGDKYPDVSKVMEVIDAGTGSSEVSLPKTQIPKVLSASVVAEWSDAQINELFSDYPDDGDELEKFLL